MNAAAHSGFQAVAEARPGPQWLAHYRQALPMYQRRLARLGSDGDTHRPSLPECRAALQQHMPELLPLWENLLTLTGASEAEARLLSFYRPTPQICGCSQAVWTRYTPALIRNFDYDPALCESRIFKTCWHDTGVIASTDCLWGVLDGMNEHGLSVSLAYGGRDEVAPGFSIALILRYLLEFCQTADEAVKVLRRVPCNMAYNVTLVDAAGVVRNVELDPLAAAAHITALPLAVNHQGAFRLSGYARWSQSYERGQFLQSRLVDPLSSLESFANTFAYSPVFSDNHRSGFGTLYTAIYNPGLRAVEYRWPDQTRMYQSFACFEASQPGWTH